MDEYQWLLLAQLLRRYDSLLTALDLMKKLFPENRRIREMEEQLKQGRPLINVLNGSRFERSLRFYVGYLDLAGCIEIVHKRLKRRDSLKKMFLSRISYQLILFAGAMVILTVFSQYVLPSMLTVLEISSQRSEDMVFLFKTVRVIRNVLLAVIIIAVSSGLYLVRRHRVNYLWMLLHRIGHDRLIRIMASYQFAGELEILLAASLSLNDALEILRFQRTDSFTSLLAYHFNDSLINGSDFSESLKNEFFDEQLSAIALYGLQEDDFVRSLTDYRSAVERKLERSLKKLSVALSAVCYGFVFVIIILAYQVLLLPLELLEDL
ncbi:MAG: type II secretion system F family protein [Erysipelotrichaceae bacterium]|nr:type II secretion system F family protein [Erysipelotrichaceae bacterium]